MCQIFLEASRNKCPRSISSSKEFVSAARSINPPIRRHIVDVSTTHQRHDFHPTYSIARYSGRLGSEPSNLASSASVRLSGDDCISPLDFWGGTKMYFQFRG